MKNGSKKLYNKTKNKGAINLVLIKNKNEWLLIKKNQKGGLINNYNYLFNANGNEYLILEKYPSEEKYQKAINKAEEALDIAMKKARSTLNYEKFTIAESILYNIKHKKYFTLLFRNNNLILSDMRTDDFEREKHLLNYDFNYFNIKEIIEQESDIKILENAEEFNKSNYIYIYLYK